MGHTAVEDERGALVEPDLQRGEKISRTNEGAASEGVVSERGWVAARP